MTNGGRSIAQHGGTYGGRSLAEWLPVVTARIFERCDAKRIVVFGSVARGDEHAGSDIDLIVVLGHVDNSHDDAVRVLRELRDLPVPVDVIVTDEERLATQSRMPGIVRVALREGTVIERAA
jgi:predicted nucleotidyltransferase